MMEYRIRNGSCIKCVLVFRNRSRVLTEDYFFRSISGSVSRHSILGLGQFKQTCTMVPNWAPFLVLVNDTSAGSCGRWKYVDDLTLGEVIKYDQQSSMQNHLDDLSSWCRNNDMLPKPTKCHTMTVSFLKRNIPYRS